MSVDTSQQTKIVPKPWGEEHHLVVTDRYCAKRLHVRAGCRLSLQYHVDKDESMALETGAARLLLGPTLASVEEIDMIPGLMYRVPPGWIHRLAAVEDSVVLEISTPELGDVVRVEDDYGRRG